MPDKHDDLSKLTEKYKALQERFDQRQNTFFTTVKYMRAILDSQCSYIFVYNHENEIIDGNLKFLQTFPYQNLDEVRKKVISIKKIQEDALASECVGLIEDPNWFELILRDQESRYRLELEEHGKVYQFEISISGMLYRSGVDEDEFEEKNLRVVTLSDVAHMIKEMDLRSEQDLMTLQKSRMDAKNEMLNMLAHQWRQPMNALCILHSQLKEDIDELTKEERDQIIDKSTKLIYGMSEMINDFSTFFKPETMPKDHSVRQSVQDAINLFSPQFTQFNVRCNFHFQDPQSEYRAFGYPDECKQVCTQLIRNACDAISVKQKELPEMQGHIDIFIESDTDTISLTIKDNGCGLPEESIDKLFEPYFTTKEELNGTGVGLFMCKMMVEKNMRGSISARNDETGGAIFIVNLPIDYMSW